MKRYKIIFILVLILILILSWLSLPNMGHIENYDSVQLSELKIMAKNNNEKALNTLMGYYSLKHDENNILLVRCATYQGLTEDEKIYTYKNAYIDDRHFLEKECPNNPIDKIKEKNSFFDKVKYFLTFKK